jgi:hypothetical protein
MFREIFEPPPRISPRLKSFVWTVKSKAEHLVTPTTHRLNRP